jgi:hypothetical protein
MDREVELGNSGRTTVCAAQDAAIIAGAISKRNKVAFGTEWR